MSKANFQSLCCIFSPKKCMERWNENFYFEIVVYLYCLLFCRHTLTQRLQKMMKSHCEEALKLLSSSSTKHSPLPEKHKVFFQLIN